MRIFQGVQAKNQTRIVRAPNRNSLYRVTLLYRRVALGKAQSYTIRLKPAKPTLGGRRHCARVSQKYPPLAHSLTPCFNWVLSKGFGISTTLAVSQHGKTAEAVLELTTATNTQLKQGVNEMPEKQSIHQHRRSYFLRSTHHAPKSNLPPNMDFQRS